MVDLLKLISLFRSPTVVVVAVVVVVVVVVFKKTISDG